MSSPIDFAAVGGHFVPAVMFCLGIALALFATMFVPPSSSRLVACVLAMVAIGALFGLAGPQNPFQLGLAIGMMLACAKLLTGVRFL